MADITVSAEQQMLVELASTVAADIASRWSLGRSRAEVSAPGNEGAVKMIAETGLLGLRSGPAAERASWTDVCLVAEQFGRHCAAAPFIGPVLAVELLRTAGAGEDIIGAVTDGAGLVTVALRADLAGLAQPDDQGPVAWDCAGAEAAVLAAPDGLTLRRIGADAVSADLTRRVAEVGAEGERVGGTRVLGAAEHSRLIAMALTLVTADIVGVMEAALDAAVEHARTREQFGVPIGSFQAVQHLAAEALVSVESTRSAMWYASWSAEARPADEALTAARSAKAFASAAGLEVAETVLQIFGGISMTWESMCHVWARRLRADRTLFGDEHAQYAALAVAPGAEG